MAARKRDREIRQEQIVAKALALGDMSMKIETMDLNLLDYDGTPLERAAMAFHHDGSGLTLKAADGSPSTYDPVLGGYTSPGGVYSVNGAPGKPGAPYADPCGAPDTLGSVTEAADSYMHQQRTVFFVDGDVDLSTTIIPEADPQESDCAGGDGMGQTACTLTPRRRIARNSTRSKMTAHSRKSSARYRSPRQTRSLWIPILPVFSRPIRQSLGIGAMRRPRYSSIW